MNDIIPAEELAYRWDRCKKLLQQYIPQAQGLLVFSRLNIYYFSGSFAGGVFWLPLSGEPVLFCRRGDERAKIESPIKHIYSFRSYSDIETILNDLGFALPKVVAAEMNGLSWALSNSLTKHLSTHRFVPADKIIGMSRAKKSEWELNIIREAGSRHANGDSANYPSVFNGPVGLRGVHPAAPYMGSAAVKWTKGKPLTIDNGFTFAGYMTDKTQVYWLGDRENMPVNALKAHNFCIDLQDQVAKLLKPGTLPSEVWNHCLAKVERSEWSDGFMGLGKNKVFFIGHGIGLAIDEYPALATG